MVAEDGPWLWPRSALRTYATYSSGPRPAINSDVPFCGGTGVVMAVVMARRSEVGRRREIADSTCADFRRHSHSSWSPGASFEPVKSRRPCRSRKLYAPGQLGGARGEGSSAMGTVRS